MGAPRRSLNPFWGWGLGPFPHGSYGNVDADFDQIVDNELEAIEQVERCGSVTSFQGLYGETRPPGYWASSELPRRDKPQWVQEYYTGPVPRVRALTARAGDELWRQLRAARLRAARLRAEREGAVRRVRELRPAPKPAAYEDLAVFKEQPPKRAVMYSRGADHRSSQCAFWLKGALRWHPLVAGMRAPLAE
jgi:hypothetical protein